MNIRTRAARIASVVLPLFFFWFAFFAFSCADENNQTYTSDIVFPDSLISFTKHVEPLFRQTCVSSQCHGGSQPAANLTLEYDAWHSLIDYQPKIVIPSHGSTSPLVMYLDGRLSPQMPFRNKPLTTNQIDGVRKWIDEGAQAN